MQDAVALSASMQDTDAGVHADEDGHHSPVENDEGSSTGGQKCTSCASASNMQPESPISEGLIVIHLHLMIADINVLCS